MVSQYLVLNTLKKKKSHGTSFFSLPFLQAFYSVWLYSPILLTVGSGKNKVIHLKFLRKAVQVSLLNNTKKQKHAVCLDGWGKKQSQVYVELKKK